MLETLIHFDELVFYFINGMLSNPVTDLVMPVITSDMLLRIMYAITVILLLWKGDSRLRWLVLVSVLVLVVTDQVSSSLLKPMIGRMRPCHTLESVNLLVGCGGGKSMPSSHAANAFGQAMLFAWLYKPVRLWLILVATLIAVSRVFVGVHYPADVLAGSALGAIVGISAAMVFACIWSRQHQTRGGVAE